MKDTWYKKLGWFLLFSLVTLAVFFVIDFAVQRLIFHLNDNEYEASFEEEVYYYSLTEQNEITLTINTNVSKYYYDVWINDESLNLKVENKPTVTIKLSDYELELTPGEYTIKSSFYGKRGISKYRETLITTKLIVE